MFLALAEVGTGTCFELDAAASHDVVLVAGQTADTVGRNIFEWFVAAGAETGGHSVAAAGRGARVHLVLGAAEGQQGRQ